MSAKTSIERQDEEQYDASLQCNLRKEPVGAGTVTNLEEPARSDKTGAVSDQLESGHIGGSREEINPTLVRRKGLEELGDLRFGGRGRRLLALCDLAPRRGKWGIAAPKPVPIGLTSEHSG